MELLPRSLVVGVVIPMPPPGVQAPGAPEITFDNLSLLFSEVANPHNYRSFQAAPDGTSGQIAGLVPTDSFVVQPPVIQFTDSVTFGAEKTAEKAHDVYSAAAKHLRIGGIIQVGVKWVYQAPTRNNDGTAFVLNNVLGKTDTDLGELSQGGSLWAGLKVVTTPVDELAAYTIEIEPLQADATHLFIAVDAQFAGTSLGELRERIMTVHNYAQRSVRNFLQRVEA